MPNTTGKNITSIPTSEIQKNLGGLVVDNKYGPKTTDAVKNFQTQNSITVDGIFGPETQAKYDAQYGTTKTDTKLITTSGSSRSEEVKSSVALDKALGSYGLSTTPTTDTTKKTATDVYKDAGIEDNAGTTSDPYIQQLDAMAERSNDSTKMLISNIKFNKSQSSQKLDKQYNDYKSGLQLLGIQTNAATVTPDILMSHINEAETEHLQKLQALDSEETKALMDAENARADNDFSTLTSKMNYVKQIRADKATALKNYNDTLTAANDPVKNAQDAKAVSHDIYDVMQTLDDADKEAFIIAVSQKLGLSPASIVAALNDVKTERDKTDATAGDAKPLSRTDLEAYNKQGYNLPLGTTVREAKAKGIVPKTIKTTTTKTADTIKAATDEITSALKTGMDADGNKVGNPKGSDGFVDPSVYIAYFNAWPGTDKEFLAKFPVVGTINPTSYSKLPESIRPKKTTTSRAS